MDGLDRRLRASFAAHQARVALTDEQSSLTFAELEREADRLAEGLIAAGLEPGALFLIGMPNTRWGAVASVATLKAGLIPVLVNPSLTAPELAFALGHCEPQGMMVGADRAAVAAEALTQAGHLPAAVFTDVPTPSLASTAYSSLPPPRRNVWAGTTSEVGMILYTSGTTGRPKGVRLLHRGLLFVIDGYRERMAWTADDVALCVLPIFHLYAQSLLLQVSLLTGSRLVLHRGFSIPGVPTALVEQKVTLFCAVPPMLQALVESRWTPAPGALSALRVILTAGAPAPRDTQVRAQERLGAPVYEGYGLTETSATVTTGPLTAPHRLGSSGLPLPGVEIRICDVQGRPLPPGQQGEVQVRTPGLFKDYLHDPEGTRNVLADGDWLRTGDIGYVDEDGYVFITDRLKDVIFVGGENVFPHEVEAVILRYPGVARAAVVRMEHKATGEAPRAFVVPEQGATVDTAALIAFLRGHLSPLKIPRKVELVAEIPTTASGKIQRGKLLATSGGG